MNWYYLENGAQRGPITEAEFPALFQIGAIRADTYVWCEGMPEWKLYSQVLAPAGPPPAIPAVAMEQPAASVPGALRVRREEAAPDSDPVKGCSQCGAMVPSSELMRIGSASLCSKCQVGYRRQAHFGFGERPADYANPFVRMAAFILDYFVGRIAREGATPIMKLMKIRVVTANGGSVGVWRALGRWLVLVLTNTFTFGLGHLIVFFDKQRRSLHDIACGTLVVKR